MGLILPGLLADATQGGGYVSALKALPVIIILMIWARLLTWIDPRRLRTGPAASRGNLRRKGH